MRPFLPLTFLLALLMPLSAHGVEPPQPGETGPNEGPPPGDAPVGPTAPIPPSASGDPDAPETPASPGEDGKSAPPAEQPAPASGAPPEGPSGQAGDESGSGAAATSSGSAAGPPRGASSRRPDNAETPESTRTVPGKYIEEDPIDPGPEPLPLGPDTLGGHVLIGAAGAWAVPFGSIESGQSQGDLFATGYALSLDIGVGIARTTVLGLAGGYGSYSADGECPGCSATSFGAGAFLRYHLVQGLSFDPWMSVGVGYRQTSLDDGPAYAGLDWADLRLGGDWYPIDNLGLGPVAGVTLTSFLSKSEGDFDGSNVAARFTLGGRIVFDAPGK